MDVHGRVWMQLVHLEFFFESLSGVIVYLKCKIQRSLREMWLTIEMVSRLPFFSPLLKEA